MTLDPQLQNTLARALIILLIILLTLLFRRMTHSVARRIIRTIWRFVNVVSRRNTTSDEALIAAITPPLRLLITIIGFHLLLVVLELPPAKITQAQIITSLVAFTIFWTFYRLVDILADHIVGSSQFFHLDQTIVSFLNQLTKALIILVLFVIIMSRFGFDLGGVVAGLGIGGLAVALAAQDALANLIGYFVIVTDAPFKVGHFIAVNSVEGTVEAITFRSTRLRMKDRAQIVIPNQTIVNGTIINWSRVDHRQIRTTLGIHTATDESQLRALITDIRTMLEGHERVKKGGQLIVEFVEYGVSSLNVLLVFNITTSSWDEMQSIKADINFRLMGLLQKHGVALAFPTTTINFDSSAAEVLMREAVSERLEERQRN